MDEAGSAPAQLTAEQTETTVKVLFEARSWGFLGPGPVEPHVGHAVGFAAAIGVPPKRLADLGSGGGVPGLVLAQLWPGTEVVLIDANQRRTDFLQRVGGELSLARPPSVVRGRAEDIGREQRWRATFDAVVARGFGAPAVTAECAAPLLRVGGILVVSEPPGDDERWASKSLAALGLSPTRRVVTSGGRFQVLEQVALCPGKYPRASGKPTKRPLF